MKTGIIIPCYNEEHRLDTQAFIDFIQSTKAYHLCFVNDGSKDKTHEVLKKMQQENPKQISVIHKEKNRGKARAVRIGTRYLYKRKDIDFVGFLDADLSTDFNDFKDLVAILKQNKELTIVFGSRNMQKSGIKRDGFRKFFSTVIKMLIYFILRMPIKDTQCGAKVFRKEILPVVYGETFLSKWLFDVEIFIRLKRFFGTKVAMQKIYEHPLKRWVHTEDSKLDAKEALQIPYRLSQLWFSYAILDRINNKTSLLPLKF